MALYETLKEYTKSDVYPFHMPGHKRRLGAVPEARDMDITEIDGFDNLHHAQGILQRAQERAARLYGVKESFYLVNGSTGGILAAISACTSYGGKLLMARNSHKAAYHAAQLRGLRTSYLLPEQAFWKMGEPTGAPVSGSILPGQVKEALEREPDIQAVFLTSPTYEGVTSDIRSIGEIVHAHGKMLIVDEAHGAHLAFHEKFPQSAAAQGADVIIQSVHKTLPALTQTALLHRNTDRCPEEKLRYYLGVYQTSSPSYVLMAGIDNCIGLLEKEGRELFSAYVKELEEFYKSTGALERIRVLEEKPLEGMFDRDPSKILISARGKSGLWLGERLRKRYRLEMEMESGDYVIALTSAADSREGFLRLQRALEELDEELKRETSEKDPSGEKIMGPSSGLFGRTIFQNEVRLTIAQAVEQELESVDFEKSEGEVCGEYLYLYPPGVPMIVPGEVIRRELIELARAFQRGGFLIQGAADYQLERIRVCREKSPVF